MVEQETTSFDRSEWNSGRSETCELQGSQPANSAAWAWASLLGERLRFLQLFGVNFHQDEHVKEKRPETGAVREPGIIIPTAPLSSITSPCFSDIPAPMHANRV